MKSGQQPWRKMQLLAPLATLPATAILLTGLLFIIFGAVALHASSSIPNRCKMSYMHPKYIDTGFVSADPTSAYRVLEYKDMGPGLVTATS